MSAEATAMDVPGDVPASAAVEAMPNGIRHPKKRAFLAAYCQVGNVSDAAKLAEINRMSHYNWLQSDERYAELFQQANEIACDHLEAEARRRAISGVEEPVFYHGEVCGTIRRYSDTLLIFLLKGARPDKFRDNATIRHTGPDGGAIQIEADYGLAERFMADPDAIDHAQALAAFALERPAGEISPAPIPASSEEVDA